MEFSSLFLFSKRMDLLGKRNGSLSMIDVSLLLYSGSIVALSPTWKDLPKLIAACFLQ